MKRPEAKVKEGIPQQAGRREGGTVEIKNVSRQDLTRQLRLQREISKGAGEEPILRINKDAKLSKPLEEGGFDIQPYQITLPPAQQDNTGTDKIYQDMEFKFMAPPEAPKAAPKGNSGNGLIG